MSHPVDLPTDSKLAEPPSVMSRYSCLHRNRYDIFIEWDDEAETYYAFVLDLQRKNFAEPIISLAESPHDYLNLDYLLKDLNLELNKIGINDFELPYSARLGLSLAMKNTSQNKEHEED